MTTSRTDDDRGQRPLHREEELAAAVHELRSPLATVRGFLETLLARGDALPEEERTRALQVALRNAILLGERIDRLLAPDRIARADQEGQGRALALRTTVEAIIEDSAGLLAGHPVWVEVDAATWVHVDREALSHVLGNLLGNAARYSPAGSPIIVRAVEGLDDVLVEVVDHGEGIDPQDLPHVFTPFYRAREGGTGSGLGLSVARRYVAGWGGRVDIESVVGEGTTVSFTLTPSPAPSPSGPGGPGATDDQ